MADEIRMESNVADLIARFNSLPAKVRVSVRDAVAGALLVMESVVRRQTGLRWRRGAAGLAGRLTSYCRLGGVSGIDAAIGFRKTRGFPYELAQEFGATAGAGGAMAIPVTPEARRLSERGLGPRAFGRPLVFVRSNGKALLMEPLRRTMRLQYVLVKSIPPRLRFRQSVAGQAGTIRAAVFAGARRGLAAA